ncbi:hypothetical protein [Thalassomonas haliotis]|uniref:Uncharacterized protein n=1 Tax=Thalassomonas haliotis TaxID=485448 RepID=A0ABY7VCR5_9GAMM|nr:hypothetical protein [Thalassomonas haliotis]WDE11081.1 hypothetical protein H3N35_23045 [Thalassomonas haliotis]
MKIKLKKTNLKKLSQDKKILPADMTPKVAGGGDYATDTCLPTYKACFTVNQWCGPTGVC